MNKKILKVLALSLTATTMAPMVTACGPSVLGGAETLSMCVSDFGYGVEWAYDLVDAFKNEAWVQEKYPRLAIPEPAITKDRGLPVTQIEGAHAPYDLYFSCDYASTPLGGTYADLTSVYEAKIPGEGETTVMEKMYPQFVEEADRDLSAEGFSAMDFPWVNGSYGLMYNKYMVEQAFGASYQMPVTTYEMVQMGNAWRAKYNPFNENNPRMIMIASRQPGWSEGAFRVMWGQYAGEQGYRDFMSGKVNGEYSVEVFKDTGRYRSLQAIEEIIGNSGNVNTIYSVEPYTTVQVNYLAGEACFMFMGDWFELEMEDFINDAADEINPNYEFYFLKTPVNSAVVEKMSIYTHGNTDYNTLSDDVKASYNTTLSKIVKAIDEGKTSLDGISNEDFAIVKEARTCKSTLGGHVAFVPEVSDAKDLAKDFLIFMASDKGIETFMKATNGVSTPFKYEIDKESDLFKGFSALQQQRINDTSIDDWYVGKGYRTPMTRLGGLTDICTQQGQEHLEIEFCGSVTRTAKEIRDAIYNKMSANNNALWNNMLIRAGINN